MSSIGARVGLIYFCDILRNSGSDNSWGSPDASWTADASYVPCRAWTTGESLAPSDDRIISTSSRFIILPLGTDVTELDRIGNVYLRDRSVLWPAAHLIDEVVEWPDRLELTLRKAI